MHPSDDRGRAPFSREDATLIGVIELGKRLGFLIMAIFIVSLDLRPPITSIGPLMTQIQHALHMNSLTASLLTAIPVFCMGIFAPLTGTVGDRMGIDRAIFACMMLIGFATLLRFFVHASALLLVSAFLAGVGIAVIGPLLSGFIKEHFAERAAAVIGIYSVGIGVGATVSAGLSIPLGSALHSWQASLGTWTVLAALGLAVWVPVLVADRGFRDEEQAKGRLPWNVGRAWLLLIAFGLQSGIYYSVTTWLAPQAEQTGYSAAGAGVVLTTFSVIQMFSSLVIPMLVHRSNKRTPWLMACAVFSVVGLALCAMPLGMTGPWIADVFLGIGLGGLFPILLILPLDEASTGDEASRWTAMMQCGGYIMSGVVPMLAGAIEDATGSYHQSFWLLVALAAALFVCSYFLKPQRQASH
ncbi:cyanate transporter [Alicyclobacillus hesperidum subsp. aegles]|nr:cyanate transporter [Alicyclobacillus hesperidum subsp. aegles]